MIAEELKRFDRTLSILLMLQSRKRLKAQQLAEKFGVSLRTIYRDIRSLEAAGVPVIGEAGSGYTIMEGYKIPPVMFTPEEATSFVAAEKLMSRFTDPGLGGHFHAAMNKVRAVLKGKEKEWLSILDAQVWVKNHRSLFNKDIPNAMEILLTSIATSQQVVLEYHSFNQGSVEKRKVEPVGVFHENDQWYLLAFCHLRKDYRQFRTDRIQHIAPTTEPFSRKHGSVTDHLKRNDDCPAEHVCIAVKKKVLPYLQNARNYHGFLSMEEKGEEVIMEFRTEASFDAFSRWYLMFGDHARVIRPLALKNKIRELAERTLLNLEQ